MAVALAGVGVCARAQVCTAIAPAPRHTVCAACAARRALRAKWWELLRKAHAPCRKEVVALSKGGLFMLDVCTSIKYVYVLRTMYTYV